MESHAPKRQRLRLMSPRPVQTMEGDAPSGWTIPSELPTVPGLPELPGLPGLPGSGDDIPPGGVEPEPGGGGGFPPFPMPELPPPPTGYTEQDLEQARAEGYAEGKRSEQASLVKSTAIAAAVSFVVGYALNRVLPND